MANIIRPPRISDLFDVKQKKGEPLKEYLNRFCEVLVLPPEPSRRDGGGRVRKRFAGESFQQLPTQRETDVNDGNQGTSLSSHSNRRGHPTKEVKRTAGQREIQGANWRSSAEIVQELCQAVE